MFLAKKHLFTAMIEIYKLIYFAIQGNQTCSLVKYNFIFIYNRVF